MLHSNTGCLREHKPSVPCSVLLSNDYVIVEVRSRNITGSTNLAYSEKINLEDLVRLSCQGLPSFLDKEKSAKCSYFPTGRCFIHPLLIFATQSLMCHHSILSFSLVCLAKVYEHSVLPDVMKDPLLIVRVILRKCSIKTLIISILRS